MNIQYIVAGPEYWDSIPQTRQLTCTRLRFTSFRCVPGKGASSYDTKAQALDAAMHTGKLLVRETQYSKSTWHYQLLIDFSPKRTQR